MTIRDDVTGAAEGRVALTAVQMANFSVIRSANYVRGAVKLTA